MNNFLVRLITGIFLMIIVIGSVAYSLFSFILLVLLINLLGLREFYLLFAGDSPKKLAGLLFSVTLLGTSTLIAGGFFDERIFILNIPIAFGIFILSLYDSSERPFNELGITFLGIIYITIPCVLLVFVAFLIPIKSAYNSEIILGLFFIVWASDSGAYGAGKLFGKHSLFKRISPHKTWEGSIGGSVCAITVSIVVSKYYTAINNIHWIAIAMIVILIGTYGDLIKSRMKRSLHVKDTGRILPGHGGILDRFDSLLSSASFVFFYLVFIDYLTLT